MDRTTALKILAGLFTIPAVSAAQTRTLETGIILPQGYQALDLRGINTIVVYSNHQTVDVDVNDMIDALLGKPKSGLL